MSFDTTEIVATFVGEDGQGYEIDHLGITALAQWGEFTVYRNGKQLAEFALTEAMLKPQYRPAELPVTTEELVDLAKAALDGR